MKFLALVLFCIVAVKCQMPVPVPVPVARAVPVPVPVPVAHAVPVPVPVVRAVPVPVPVPVGMGMGMGMPIVPIGLGVGPRRLNKFMRKAARRMMASNMIAANMALVGVGKRDVSNSSVEEEEVFPANKTLCNFSSQRGILSCHGVNHNFDCEVTLKLTGLEKLKLRLADLELVPAEEKNFNVLRLFSHDSKFTVVEPVSKKKIVLSLFNAEHVSEPGLLIKDSTCWSNVESLVRESPRENIRLAIFL